MFTALWLKSATVSQFFLPGSALLKAFLRIYCCKYNEYLIMFTALLLKSATVLQFLT